MEAASLPIPVFVKTPYGELRQVGLIEAELGCDIEQAITLVQDRLRGL